MWDAGICCRYDLSYKVSLILKCVKGGVKPLVKVTVFTVKHSSFPPELGINFNENNYVYDLFVTSTFFLYQFKKLQYMLHSTML